MKILMMTPEAAQALRDLEQRWLAMADISLGEAAREGDRWVVKATALLPDLEPALKDWLAAFRDQISVGEVDDPALLKIQATLGPVHDRPEFTIDEDDTGCSSTAE